MAGETPVAQPQPKDIKTAPEEAQFVRNALIELNQIKETVDSHMTMEYPDDDPYNRTFQRVILLKDDGSVMTFDPQDEENNGSLVSYDPNTTQCFYLEAEDLLIGPKSVVPTGRGVKHFGIRVYDRTGRGIDHHDNSFIKLTPAAAPSSPLYRKGSPFLTISYGAYLSGLDELEKETIHFKFEGQDEDPNDPAPFLHLNVQEMVLRHKSEKTGRWVDNHTKWVPFELPEGFYPEELTFGSVENQSRQRRVCLESLKAYKQLFIRAANTPTSKASKANLLPPPKLSG